MKRCLIASVAAATAMAAHAQGTISQAWGGNVSLLGGNGSGYGNSEYVNGTFSANANDFVWNSGIGGFIDTSANVTVNPAGGTPSVYNDLALELLIGGSDSQGHPQDLLYVTWGNSYADLNNVLNLITVTIPDGTYTSDTMANIESALQSGLNNVVQYSGNNYDNAFYLSTDPNGANFAQGNLNTFQIESTPEPALSLSRSGTNAVISWPTNNAANLNLYRSASLLGTNWNAVNIAPIVSNGTNFVTVPATNPAAFFRLQ